MEVKNIYVIIKANINGALEGSDFEIKIDNLFEPGSKEVIVKNLYVSIDPYQINRMKSQSSSQRAITYSLPITPGEGIDTYGVGRVMVSDRLEFKKGDLVAGLLSWRKYTRMKVGTLLNNLDPMDFPLSYHVGIFGFSGLAAYGGFIEVCKPKQGEKVFVSAASGSVGHLVGQYAKLIGCYVVSCAGSPEKLKALTIKSRDWKMQGREGKSIGKGFGSILKIKKLDPALGALPTYTRRSAQGMKKPGTPPPCWALYPRDSLVNLVGAPTTLRRSASLIVKPRRGLLF